MKQARWCVKAILHIYSFVSLVLGQIIKQGQNQSQWINSSEQFHLDISENISFDNAIGIQAQSYPPVQLSQPFEINPDLKNYQKRSDGSIAKSGPEGAEVFCSFFGVSIQHSVEICQNSLYLYLTSDPSAQPINILK